MFCPKCGKPVGEDDTFCPYCGNKIEERPATAEVSFGRRFESDSRGEVRETSAVAGKTLKLKTAIIYLVLTVVGLVGSIFAMICSMEISTNSDYMTGDEIATNVVLFTIGVFLGLLLSIIPFGWANKMGREKQPYKPLQIAVVCISSISLALSVVALVFQGVTLIIS